MTPSIGVRRLSTRLCAMSSWASAFPGRPAIVPPSVSGICAIPIHVRGPALIEATLVLLGDPVGEHPRTVVGSVVLPETHLVVVGVAPRDDPLAGERGVAPVLHVVLLGHPGRPRIAEVIVPEDVLHFRRRVGIHQEPTPGFGLQGPAWVPDGAGAP